MKDKWSPCIVDTDTKNWKVISRAEKEKKANNFAKGDFNIEV